jgi:hypothetical protein
MAKQSSRAVALKKARQLLSTDAKLSESIKRAERLAKQSGSSLKNTERVRMPYAGAIPLSSSAWEV